MNIANQLMISVSDVFGIMGLEFYSTIILNNVLVSVSMIQYAFDGFENEYLIYKKKYDGNGIKRNLRNILIETQDLDR